MLSWNYKSLQNWISLGCDKKIALNVIKLELIHNNNIKVLPKEIGHLINLEVLNFSGNEITELIPEIGKLIHLQKLYCESNKITKFIPEIGNLINLKEFSFSSNEITKLIPEIGNLNNLVILCFSNNKITELIPEIGNLINLQILNCSNNSIIKLIPEIGNLIHLHRFYCSYNKIIELIPEIKNLIKLQNFFYYENPIEYINPQLLRFITRQTSQSNKSYQMKEDITKSIHYIMCIKPTITIDELKNLIINNIILTQRTKDLLIKYSDNTEVHSLDITFEELLLNVYSFILKNENSNKIFQIMNTEMSDPLCECFTGRIGRLINCLSRFDNKIQININNNEQIKNILLLKNKYDIKNILLEKNYELNIIEEWLECIK